LIKANSTISTLLAVVVLAIDSIRNRAIHQVFAAATAVVLASMYLAYLTAFWRHFAASLVT
jgi:uncharacterized membrane protein YfhO